MSGIPFDCQDVDFPQPESDSATLPVIVPSEQLSADTLRNLARDLLLRERGNDDLESDVDDDRITALLTSIAAGRHLITFDPVSQSVGILAAADFKNKS